MLSLIRGCLHDTGGATFIQAPVHSGSLLCLCIRLHDTKGKCHAGASHTGASSPRFLCRSEIFIPARKFIPVSCKRGMTVRFIFIKISSILRHYKTRTPRNTALCKHGATFHLAPEWTWAAPLSCKHPLSCICTANLMTVTFLVDRFVCLFAIFLSYRCSFSNVSRKLEKTWKTQTRESIW